MAFKIKNSPIQIKQIEDDAVIIKFGQTITTQNFMPDPEKIIIRRRRGAIVQGGGTPEPALYVSNAGAGTGDGSSEANAMSLVNFQALDQSEIENKTVYFL